MHRWLSLSDGDTGMAATRMRQLHPPWSWPLAAWLLCIALAAPRPGAAQLPFHADATLSGAVVAAGAPVLQPVSFRVPDEYLFARINSSALSLRAVLAGGAPSLPSSLSAGYSYVVVRPALMANASCADPTAARPCVSTVLLEVSASAAATGSEFFLLEWYVASLLPWGTRVPGWLVRGDRRYYGLEVRRADTTVRLTVEPNPDLEDMDIDMYAYIESQVCAPPPQRERSPS